MKLEITSLRKGGDALLQALQAWRGGQALAVPSECGFFVLDQQPAEVWLSAAAPPTLDDSLSKVFEVFWPGPLRLRLASAEGKRSWQVPAHPLAQALLKLAEEPVAARWLGECPEDFEGLQLHWKEPPLQLVASEVDCACTPWRWLRSGAVERRELEWAAGQKTLLSGAALPDLEPLPAPRFREKQSYRVEP